MQKKGDFLGVLMSHKLSHKMHKSKIESRNDFQFYSKHFENNSLKWKSEKWKMVKIINSSFFVENIFSVKLA